MLPWTKALRPMPKNGPGDDQWWVSNIYRYDQKWRFGCHSGHLHHTQKNQDKWEAKTNWCWLFSFFYYSKVLHYKNTAEAQTINTYYYQELLHHHHDAVWCKKHTCGSHTTGSCTMTEPLSIALCSEFVGCMDKNCQCKILQALNCIEATTCNFLLFCKLRYIWKGYSLKESMWRTWWDSWCLYQNSAATDVSTYGRTIWLNLWFNMWNHKVKQKVIFNLNISLNLKFKLFSSRLW